MSMADEQTAWLCLEHLNGLSAKEGAPKELLGEAMQKIAEAYSLNIDDIDQKESFSFEPNTLLTLLEAGAGALGAKTQAQQQVEIEANPLFQKLLATVTAKGFFKGTVEGEPEYKERYRKMVSRFKQKLEANAATSAPPLASSEAGASALPPPPPPAAAAAASPAAAASTSAPADACPDAAVAANGDSKEGQAEAYKNEGNALLQSKNYEAAVEAYTKAIQTSPDGPKSHIYFANRAAARQYLKQHQGAMDDCEASIAREPSYAKAHSRLGATHGSLGDWTSAAASYQRSLDLDPKNAATAASLKQAKAKAASGGSSGGGRQVAGAPGPMGGGGFPGMPPGGMDPAMMQQAMAMMGGGGGPGGGGPGGMPGGLAGMMNNPAMMQMAQGMMQNPVMMQQAQQMMQNPAMMQQAMSMMGGGGGSGGGAPGGGGMDPELAAAMQAMQNGGPV